MIASKETENPCVASSVLALGTNLADCDGNACFCYLRGFDSISTGRWDLATCEATDYVTNRQFEPIRGLS